MPETRMTERASILIVNRVYPPVRGATGRLLHDLARHFVKTGYNVTIVTTGAKAKNVSRGAITIERVSGDSKPNIWGYLLVLWRLYRAMMRQKRHDIVITLSDPPLLYMAGHQVARKKKSAHVHWCQDLYPDLLPVLGFNVPSGIYERVYNASRQCMGQADCVVAISRCMQRYLTQHGVDLRRTAVIENWPDQELVQKTSAVSALMEANLPHKDSLRDRKLYSDPAGQRFRVLYAGNLGRAHPIESVIQAARILHKTQPDIELVFAGTGPGYETLADARARLSLDNIRLMPPQPRSGLRALMESGDVHLVTMHDETLGMLLPSKFYSALAVGRPTVFAGPAESDIARLIARHACGKVVRPNDGKALAAAIAQYRNDADAWFAGQEGAKAALVGRLPSEAFASWSSVVKKLLHGRR